MAFCSTKSAEWGFSHAFIGVEKNTNGASKALTSKAMAKIFFEWSPKVAIHFPQQLMKSLVFHFIITQQMCYSLSSVSKMLRGMPVRITV